MASSQNFHSAHYSLNISHYFPFLAPSSVRFQSGHSYFPDVNHELWAIRTIWRIPCRQQNCKIDIIFNLNWGKRRLPTCSLPELQSSLSSVSNRRAIRIWMKSPRVRSRHQLFLLRRQFPGHFLNWNFICSTITIWNVSLNGGYNYCLGDTILGSISLLW